MMPKVTLLAPDGVRGQIHASQSGKNYDIAEDGFVIVDHIDVTDLLSGGYTHAHRHGSEADRDPGKPPISSVATGSHEFGATAIDPADRQMYQRQPEGEIQPNQDHGGATPPHGDPQRQASTQSSRAEAQEEVDQAERDDVDPEHRSQVADTGHMGADQPNADDQADARGEPNPPSDVLDPAYDATFREPADPKIRGKTKVEVDAGK